MPKQTTAQVAKVLGITKGRLRLLISDHPHLRPSERTGSRKQLLWSVEETDRIRTHLTPHPFRQT